MKTISGALSAALLVMLIVCVALVVLLGISMLGVTLWKYYFFVDATAAPTLAFIGGTAVGAFIVALLPCKGE